MKKKNIQPDSFTGLIKEIRGLITAARNAVINNINIAQVITNFEIGRRIVEHEQKGVSRAQYGKQLLPNLSRNLMAEFGTGFSERNLRNIRKFYLVYQDRSSQIWQMASAKFGKSAFTLSWSQYVFLV